MYPAEAFLPHIDVESANSAPGLALDSGLEYYSCLKSAVKSYHGLKWTALGVPKPVNQRRILKWWNKFIDFISPLGKCLTKRTFRPLCREFTRLRWLDPKNHGKAGNLHVGGGTRDNWSKALCCLCF